MIEVYKFILKNLIENKDLFTINISFTRVRGRDLVLMPGKIIFINKEELIKFLIESGFSIESLIINNMEMLTLTITKEKLVEQEKKY